MTNPQYTHVEVIADRSGSMHSIREDAEGGMREFIRMQSEQATASGNRVTITLHTFDHQRDTQYRFKPIDQAPTFKLIPRGSTALLDAIGYSVVELGEALSAMPEHERPGKVVLVILTDGIENSSTEYTEASTIREMLERQQAVYNWAVLYLSAGQEAWQVSKLYGVRPNTVSNFTKSGVGTRGAFRAAGQTVSRIQVADEDDVAEAASFTADERKGMVDDAGPASA